MRTIPHNECEQVASTDLTAEHRRSSQILLDLTDLADVPITDPFREKAFADLSDSDLIQDLARQTRNRGKISAEPLRARIIEIYRRCYVERLAGKMQPESVIADFVAAYPQLVFEADWLQALVETQATNRDFRPGGARKKVFQAMANGFRRVANPEARVNRSMRGARMEAARHFLLDLRRRLSDWDRTLDRASAPTADWIESRATEKLVELVQEHSQLERCRDRLKTLLCAARLYEASILMAATIFQVRERDLQTRSS